MPYFINIKLHNEPDEKYQIISALKNTISTSNLLGFDYISFKDVLQKGLKVMDTTAFTLSQENELPIIVFDMNTKGNLLRVVSGEKIGTKVNL